MTIEDKAFHAPEAPREDVAELRRQLARATERVSRLEAESEHRYKWAMAVQAQWSAAEERESRLRSMIAGLIKENRDEISGNEQWTDDPKKGQFCSGANFARKENIEELERILGEGPRQAIGQNEPELAKNGAAYSRLREILQNLLAEAECRCIQGECPVCVAKAELAQQAYKDSEGGVEGHALTARRSVAPQTPGTRQDRASDAGLKDGAGIKPSPSEVTEHVCGHDWAFMDSKNGIKCRICGSERTRDVCHRHHVPRPCNPVCEATLPLMKQTEPDCLDKKKCGAGWVCQNCIDQVMKQTKPECDENSDPCVMHRWVTAGKDEHGKIVPWRSCVECGLQQRFESISQSKTEYTCKHCGQKFGSENVWTWHQDDCQACCKSTSQGKAGD